MGKRSASVAGLRSGGRLRTKIRKHAFNAKRVVSKRVVRRVSSLHRRRRGKKQEFGGGFTTCFPSKLKRRRYSRTGRVFAKRVRNVIYSDIPRDTELRNYTWQIQELPDGTSNIASCHWFQFGLDVINDTNANGGFSGSVMSASSGDYCQGICYRAGGLTNVAPALITAPYKPDINSIITNSTMPFSETAGTVKIRKMYSSLKLTFKNPRQIALVLEMYTVRPKKGLMFNAANTQFTPLGAFGAGIQPGASANPAFGQTKTTGLTLLTASDRAEYYMSTQLMDSSIFRETYTITKKCRVYIPAGGMLEKMLVHKNRRQFTSDYISRYMVDRGSEWLVCKVYAEPVVNTGGYCAQPLLPTGEVAPIMIGYAQWRMTLKMIEEAARVDVQGYKVNIPATNQIAGNAVMTHAKL